MSSLGYGEAQLISTCEQFWWDSSECTRGVSGYGWWRATVNVTSTLADKFGQIAGVSDDSDELKLSLMVSLVTWRRMKRWRHTCRYFDGYCKRQSRQRMMMVIRDSRDMMQESSTELGIVILSTTLLLSSIKSVDFFKFTPIVFSIYPNSNYYLFTSKKFFRFLMVAWYLNTKFEFWVKYWKHFPNSTAGRVKFIWLINGQ